MDCHGKPLVSEVGLKAMGYLHAAFDLARQNEDDDTAYRACMELANLHGSMGKAKCAEQLVLAQSFRFRGKARTMFESMSATNNRERLFLLRRDRIRGAHVWPEHCDRHEKDTAFLEEKSVTWERLQTSQTVEEMCQGLPENVKCLVLHLEREPRPFIYAALVDKGTEGDEGSAPLREVTRYYVITM